MAEEGKTLFSKDQKDFDDVFRRAAEGKKIDEAQENIDWLNKQHYTSYDKFMEGMDENINDGSVRSALGLPPKEHTMNNPGSAKADIRESAEEIAEKLRKASGSLGQDMNFNVNGHNVSVTPEIESHDLDALKDFFEQHGKELAHAAKGEAKNLARQLGTKSVNGLLSTLRKYTFGMNPCIDGRMPRM